MSVKSIIKKLIPPFVFDVRKRVFCENSLYYFGNFASWKDAVSASNSLYGDYTNVAILDKVEAATQAVRHGEALWDRDGVCFYEPDNNWILLAALFYIKAIQNRVSVLDFGGGCGSTFFQYRNFIKEINADWSIVEQKHYVERGKKGVPELEFFYSLDEATESSHNPNVLLLSSVLMYIDDPYLMFGKMLSKNFDYVIIDINAFFSDENAKACFMLQHVPASIYKAIYPAYIFGLNDFRQFINNAGYSIIWEWSCGERTIPIKTAISFKDTLYKGFLLKRNR